MRRDAVLIPVASDLPRGLPRLGVGRGGSVPRESPHDRRGGEGRRRRSDTVSRLFRRRASVAGHVGVGAVVVGTRLPVGRGRRTRQFREDAPGRVDGLARRDLERRRILRRYRRLPVESIGRYLGRTRPGRRVGIRCLVRRPAREGISGRLDETRPGDETNVSVRDAGIRGVLDRHSSFDVCIVRVRSDRGLESHVRGGRGRSGVSRDGLRFDIRRSHLRIPRVPGLVDRDVDSCRSAGIGPGGRRDGGGEIRIDGFGKEDASRGESGVRQSKIWKSVVQEELYI